MNQGEDTNQQTGRAQVKDLKALTVPAGKTLPYLTEHNVYSCPVNHPKHSAAVEIFAPRDIDGTIRRYYLIKARGVADPMNLVFHPSTNSDVENAVRGYVCAVRHISGILDEGGMYRFYYLADSRDESFLPHSPKIDQSGAVHGYISMRELLSGVPVVHLLERCV